MLSTSLRLRLLGRLSGLGAPLGGGDVEEDDANVVGTTGGWQRHKTGGKELLSWCHTAAYLTRAGTAPVGLANKSGDIIVLLLLYRDAANDAL